LEKARNLSRLIQAEDESRKQKKKVNAHISGFVKTAAGNSSKEKELQGCLQSERRQTKTAATAANTREAVEHFVKRSPGIGEGRE